MIVITIGTREIKKQTINYLIQKIRKLYDYGKSSSDSFMDKYSSIDR